MTGYRATGFSADDTGVLRASLPVVTAMVAVVVEGKRPGRHETWALVMLTAGVCLTVFEGNAAGNAVGLVLACAGEGSCQVSDPAVWVSNLADETG